MVVPRFAEKGGKVRIGGMRGKTKRRKRGKKRSGGIPKRLGETRASTGSTDVAQREKVGLPRER